MNKKKPNVCYFVDYENRPYLPLVAFKKKDTVLLFLGQYQKQFNVEFVKQLLDLRSKIDIEIIQAVGMGKNNLDFHIAYELGERNRCLNTDIEFVIVSNDTGFDNLISYINLKGRLCSRIK